LFCLASCRSLFLICCLRLRLRRLRPVCLPIARTSFWNCSVHEPDPGLPHGCLTSQHERNLLEPRAELGVSGVQLVAVERVPQVQSAEREDNGGAGGYENEGSAFTLQPPPDVALVRQILRGKPSLEIALLSRNDHQHHEGQRRKKRDQQAETVDPRCESELKERESEIDRIPAEGVRSGSHDDRRRKVARDGSAGLPERAH